MSTNHAFCRLKMTRIETIRSRGLQLAVAFHFKVVGISGPLLPEDVLGCREGADTKLNLG